MASPLADGAPFQGFSFLSFNYKQLANIIPTKQSLLIKLKAKKSSLFVSSNARLKKFLLMVFRPPYFLAERGGEDHKALFRGLKNPPSIFQSAVENKIRRRCFRMASHWDTDDIPPATALLSSPPPRRKERIDCQ